MVRGQTSASCTYLAQAGAECGLLGNFHGDELNPMQSGALAASTGSRAVSHLEHLDDADITAMAAGHVFGVLLPTTAYLLRLAPPPARKLIDNGMGPTRVRASVVWFAQGVDCGDGWRCTLAAQVSRLRWAPISTRTRGACRCQLS